MAWDPFQNRRIFGLKIAPRIVRISAVVAVAALALIQFLPILRPTNPPQAAEPPWDSSETRALAKRACFDCHSNETAWPWYIHAGPVRWLIVRDVNEGRSAMNFSDWHSGDMSGAKAAKEISEGGMPLIQYRALHPEARLTGDEKQRLMDGLRASLK